jgi:hypothetical protein
MVTASVTQYRDEYIYAFERRQSLLKDTVMPHFQINGDKAVFLVSGSGGAIATTRGMNGKIPSRQNTNTQYTVTLQEAHDKVEHSKFDVFSSQGDQRRLMQESSMAVVNRDIDSKIITALEAGTNTTTTATAVTLENITNITAELFQNDVMSDGNIFAAVTPKYYAKLQQIKEFASADYVNTKPFTQNSFGEANISRAKFWLDVHWIRHTGLTGMGTASETCIFYHKNSIGHAVDKENIQVFGGYNEEDDYYFARTSLYHNALLLQNDGIYKYIHNGA